MPINRDKIFEPPTKGLNAKANIMAMSLAEALVLDNWIPYPDALETRPGNQNHIDTYVGAPLQRLWTYADNDGTESLWGTSDTGIYNCTTAGALPALSIALVRGETIATSIATGADNYLIVVNGQDTLKQYDGTSWSSVATLGAVATEIYKYVETYNQRLFFIRKNSLTFDYLAINSISGVPTSYELGAVFRRGGSLTAMGTWSIDGGAGPDDKLVFVTSMGEIAVFQGDDPSAAATWSLQGVYYIGKPLGLQPLSKFGGDLLYLSDVGIFPLSKALQSASINYTTAISDKIQPILSAFAELYIGFDGWQIMVQPNIPLLIVNIPSAPMRVQYCMHLTNKSWCSFSGWEAYNFGILNNELYFSTATSVQKVTGVSDQGNDIIATVLSGYDRLGYSKTKRVAAMRPYFQPNAPFNYILGMANDFETNPDGETISPPSGATYSIWDIGLWGSAFWASTGAVLQDWRAPADLPKTWKAIYLRVATKSATIRYLGAEAKLIIGKGMGY